MKKLLPFIAFLILSASTFAQQNTTAAGAYTAVCKSLGAFDTTTAFKLMGGKLLTRFTTNMRSDIQSLTTKQVQAKIDETKLMFSSAELKNTVATDTVTAMFVSGKKKYVDDQNKEHFKTHDTWFVFTKTNGLWYFVMVDDADEVEDAFTALKGKLGVKPKKDE